MKHRHLISLLAVGLALCSPAAQAGTVIYRNAILADSPVAYWELDETSGTTAADSSGNGKDGTYSAVGYTLGQPSAYANLGTAIALTGAGDGGYVDVPAIGTYAQVTIELWFNLNAATGIRALFASDAFGGTEGIHLNRENTYKINHAFGPGGDDEEVLTANNVIEVGTWYHLVVTHDSTIGTDNTIIYLNGSPIATGTHGATDPIIVGASQIGAWNATREVNGSIDEVALYDTVLSSTQVADHYAAAVGGSEAPAPVITSISSVGGDLWDLTLKGEPETDYQFRSSTALDFTPGTLVENLVLAGPGSIGGANDSVLTTDSNGDGTVRVTLTGDPADFVRAQTVP